MQHPTDSASNPSPKTSVSERKAAANRANAQRSTGPRTPEGKQRSSLNALRHGILAKAAFNATLEGEERRADFDELVAGLAQEYQPRTMTEKMTVQQLAGCYWRLAKVWTFEQEAAWRARAIHSVGLDEYEQLERLKLGYLNDKMIKHQHAAFDKAGLGEVNLPLAASANTILRYQSAINSMMTKCLAILERRRKERIHSDEAFEEVDYTNEATVDAPKTKASNDEAPAPSKQAQLHKRTQNDQPDTADPALSLNQDAENGEDGRAPSAPVPSEPPRSV
jgi:hypothetical protein